MKLIFNISYKTVFGEELFVNVTHREAGEEGLQESKFRMSSADGEHWQYELTVPERKNLPAISYYYSVDTVGIQRRCEWQAVAHRVELSAVKAASYILYDQWTDIPEDSYLYSSAFTDCINKRKVTPVKESSYEQTIRLLVRAPQLRASERLAMVGTGCCLGDWEIQKALPLTEHDFNEWCVDLDAQQFSDGKMEFKFIALDESEPMWEDGQNRVILLPKMESGEAVVYSLNQAFFPIYNEKLAGTVVPVFSLRSENSFGVGDFGDLKQMVDFLTSTHQRVLQILPINDTTTTHTWTDSYPYSCISIFALHPQYADFNQLPVLKDEKLQAEFTEERKALNALREIDYEKMMAVKTRYLKVLFDQEGAKMMRTKAFKRFFAEAQQWLVPYAQYCYLRDKNATAEFSRWPDHHAWDEADRSALSNPRTMAYKKVAFCYFVQYILNTQLEAVHEYARKEGVILKGDIPIGVNRHGCDVWMEPEYFNLDEQTGAPPDSFSKNGQNWGFPTYNWDEMFKDGCQWWVRRFQNMSKFFDAYRIDHVLGFFRIWTIPVDAVHGLLGQFSPALGMTREEIEAYGLHFQEEQFTKPFISDWVLDRIFHEHADEVKDAYLTHIHDDIWEMKPQYDTQRKVEKAFSGKTNEAEVSIRDGLYELISDVLFVRDRSEADKFHPRISAQSAFVYEALYDDDKAAFDRLYIDYYYHRNDHFWQQEAMRKLPRLVQATRMLACAEDLGMVPDCVAGVMRELRILSLEIQSMPKDPAVRFGHLSHNPYRSVCTISTHDMCTLRQWWDEDNERTQDYYNSMLHRSGDAPHPLPGWLARDIVFRHLCSTSMFCILSLQDWLSIDEQLRLSDQDAERINVPADAHHYWRYRMHLNIEDLKENDWLKKNIIEIVLESGRK